MSSLIFHQPERLPFPELLLLVLICGIHDAVACFWSPFSVIHLSIYAILSCLSINGTSTIPKFRSGVCTVHFSSVAQSCLTLCNPMNCSMPGLPVHHQLPELTQTHDHRVSDAIQPSHPVVPFSSCLQSFPASGSFQMSQFFTSRTKVLEF